MPKFSWMFSYSLFEGENMLEGQILFKIDMHRIVFIHNGQVAKY
jgi:hypothetical protein